jgi:branched-chain amino acid transport system permease protein
VIWIPSGESVAYGTLTLAGLQLGKPPGTIGLLVGMALAAGAMEAYACLRGREPGRIPGRLARWTAIPLAIAAASWWLATASLPFWAQILVTLALVTPLAAPTDRLPPIAGRACWCC